MDGLVQWWKFDENDGRSSIVEVSDRVGTLVGLNNADRVFGYEGKALRFQGDGSNVIFKSYKGITGTNPRTLALWLKHPIQMPV